MLDNFLVGDGWGAKPVGMADQLMPRQSESFSVEIEDDLSQFDSIEKTDFNPLDLLYERKAAVFELFSFFDIKSAMLGDRPLRKRDLVLSDEDFALAEHAELEYFAACVVADLLAYLEMGIDTVRFDSTCSCPLCTAVCGTFYSVSMLLGLYCNGGFVTHRCPFSPFPVIYRETYRGPLRGYLDRDFSEVFSCPVEYSGHSLLAEREKPLRFVSMPSYCREHDIPGEGIVVYDTKDELVVHNSYVDCFGPMDFLKTFLEKPQKADIPENSEIFYVKGRKAVCIDSVYYDALTGERI